MHKTVVALSLLLSCGLVFSDKKNTISTKINSFSNSQRFQSSQSLGSKEISQNLLQSNFQQKKYNGKRISLNFQDIKVRAVLQLLADFTGINLVVSDKVTGNITLSLNNIPWTQALDIILATRNLNQQKIGDIMLISPAEKITKHGGENVRRDLNRIDLVPLVADLIHINYAKANDIASLIKDPSAGFLSGSGSLSVDPRTNTIWVQDRSSYLKNIKEVINQLDVPIKQVLIEARIVNATKDFARDLGVRFGVSKPNHVMGHLQSEVKQLSQNASSSDSVPLAERLNLDLAAIPLSASPASVGIALAKLGNGILLDLELSALESEGKGEIISRPRLITANQHAAVIESGEEIPYQEITPNGATAVVFKKAVLSLKVTPQIASDRSILMDIHINQDIPSVKVFNGVPSIMTKEIQTSVLIKNGQTIVLGGIYKQDKYHTLNRVPFLGVLPIVGSLFRNSSTIIKNEELLIFITPRIITNKGTCTK